MPFPGLQVKGLQAAISRKTLHVHRQLHHSTGTAGKIWNVPNPAQTKQYENAVSFIMRNATLMVNVVFTGSIQFCSIIETVCTMHPHPFFGSMWPEEVFDAI